MLIRRSKLPVFLSGLPLMLGVVLLAAGWSSPVAAQDPMGHEDTVANPTPPPAPPKPEPKDGEKGVTRYSKITPDSDKPWGLDEKLLEQLHVMSETYIDYAVRFTCDENARMAEYKSDGEVKERQKKYAYLLVKDDQARSVREFRQELDRTGNVKPERVDDGDPFPPAYAWVFLFSRFNEPYFSYRYLDNRFDGFDWIHEIQFKGGAPFTDGQDIRQWEGTIIIDAVRNIPLEIRAEPAGQQDRIEALYRQYVSSFNVLGMRTKPRPLGYKAMIEYRHRLNDLSFPTALRYDTFEAVSASQVQPLRASSRNYENYRFYNVKSKEQPGTVVPGGP